MSMILRPWPPPENRSKELEWPHPAETRSRLGAVGHFQFSEDMIEVGFDGAFGNDQSFGDGPVASPLDNLP